MKVSIKAAIVGFGMLAFCAPANAVQISGTVDYYEHTSGGDFGGNGAGGHFANEVTGTLVNGRPVYNSGYGGPALTQVDGDGRLLWWEQGQSTGSTGFSTNSAG